MKIMIINGPNLNLLGSREPGIYGGLDYAGLCDLLQKECTQCGFQCEIRQSNHEGDLVDWMHEAAVWDGVVINPGAYTHTSIALHDAIKAIATPVIEVHISNVHAREEFRRHSMIAPVAAGTISGLGIDSYLVGIKALKLRLNRSIS